MAREQLNVGDLLPLLETSDLQQLDEVKGLINEHLSTERGSVLLNGLVDYFLETESTPVTHILCSVREPHDKHLFDKMNECMAKPACRLSTLTLLGHVVRKQPSWIHKIARYPLLLSLLRCLKMDTDAVVLITAVLVLVTLLPMIPQAGKQHLYEVFDIFGRLAAWTLRNPGHVSEVHVIHLHAGVYSLFHRLYGMYPCNFISYLRSHYSMKENVDTFEEVVKPMLEHVRIHPELVTGTKDHELDPTRWKKFEIHDIVIECAKVSLDPREASCEAGYSAQPEHFCAQMHVRPPDPTASPYADFCSSYGSASSVQSSTPRQPVPPSLPWSSLSGTQPVWRSPFPTRWTNSSCEFNSTCGVKDVLWSPSSLCGMATPPSSRGMSPNPETSQSAFHLSGRLHSIQGGKGTPCSGTPAASSPPPNLADELSAASLSHSATSLPYRDGRTVDPSKPPLLRQDPVRELEKAGGEVTNHRGGVVEPVPMTLNELSVYMKEQEQQKTEKEEAALMEELVTLTEMKLRDGVGRSGFDSPFYRTTETLTGAREKPLSVSAHGVPPRDPHTATSTPDKAEARPGRRAMGSRGGSQEQPWAFEPLFTPVEQSAPGVLRRSPSTDDEGLRYGPPLSPGPCRAPPLPYEALFDLTLPHAASVFVRHRTVAALDRADSEGGQGAEAGQGRGAQRPTTSASPLEVLDQLVQQGSMAHDCVLQRSPLPSKSADWTHFGDLQALRSQLLLLHNQLLFERYKREQHALRNRRLLRRIINTTALQEQNNAMKDQLNLQSVDIVSLRESLQVEQQRYRELCEEKEAVVSRLHAQIGQLQQDHDDYCTKNQELESKLQECQKRRRETEAELQTANNEVCHTGHLLKQLTAKLSSSESTQQQLGFLSRQLLLLGEAHKLCVQELQQSGPDTTKEVEMLKASATKEVEHLKLSLLLQGQKLEAAQQRAAELETQLSKKEHLIAEQKLFLEDVKCQAKEELQASESRYQAQRSLTQAFHTELLQLYSRLEMEAHTATAATSPAGGAAEHHHHTETCVLVMDGLAKPVSKDHGEQSSHGNGTLLQPGRARASHPNPETKSINGSRDTPPPVLVEPPPPRPHTPLGPPGPSAPPAAPLTVGSYPSAKSFLGMRARELFRNKSESQCDEGDALRPQFTSLSQGLKTELCVEPPVKTAPGPAHTQGPAPSTLAACDASQKGGNQGGAGFSGAPAPPRQQQLRIMDYNESHLDHS
ncbi:TSC complex subunit 1b isoform X2 [Electrophorus electricus]|uniref:TSC complex subunit 1b isoform X2 n=1 Tax=Electrophorus electricus TaxID=8005 RepID=UPI0015D0B3F6|nr:TSC complex subunit 1b isoform X2 [Electrophorus electricus]